MCVHVHVCMSSSSRHPCKWFEIMILSLCSTNFHLVPKIDQFHQMPPPPRVKFPREYGSPLWKLVTPFF